MWYVYQIYNEKYIKNDDIHNNQRVLRQMIHKMIPACARKKIPKLGSTSLVWCHLIINFWNVPVYIENSNPI